MHRRRAIALALVLAVPRRDRRRPGHSPAAPSHDQPRRHRVRVWRRPLGTSRAGGPARRLTATPEVENDPHFSPDGSLIAFTRTSGGNTDVYVVPTAGGEPQAAHLSSRAGSRARLVARRQARDLRLRSRERAASRRISDCGACPSTADSRSRCRCRARSAAHTRPTAGASHTRRSRRRSLPTGTRRACGVTTAAVARIPFAHHGSRELLRREAAVEGQQ